jgi:hypothetical protein
MTTSPPTPPQATRRTWWRRFGSGEGLGVACVLLVVGLLLVALALDSSGNFLYQFNEYVVWIVVLAALGGAAEAGYQLGRRAKAQARETAEGTEGHTHEIQTAVFAVLGLLLAFTFAMAVSRFDDRKQALTEETTAIQTAYLRTQLLPADLGTSEATLLRQYVDVRLASARPKWYLDAALRNKTRALQQQMWSPAAAAAKQDPQSNPVQLFVESLNDVISAQGRRDAARLNHLPGSALYLLFAVSALAVGILGYQSGLGTGRSVLGTVLLVLLFATILVIILDIDQPYQGLITISQQSLIDLRQSMGNGSSTP